MFTLTMWLPRPDGTKDVFCEMSTRTHRPCNGHVTFYADNELKSGVAIYTPLRTDPHFYCSWKCVIRKAKQNA